MTKAGCPNEGKWPPGTISEEVQTLEELRFLPAPELAADTSGTQADRDSSSASVVAEGSRALEPDVYSALSMYTCVDQLVQRTQDVFQDTQRASLRAGDDEEGGSTGLENLDCGLTAWLSEVISKNLLPRMRQVTCMIPDANVHVSYLAGSR